MLTTDQATSLPSCVSKASKTTLKLPLPMICLSGAREREGGGGVGRGVGKEREREREGEREEETTQERVGEREKQRRLSLGGGDALATNHTHARIEPKGNWLTLAWRSKRPSGDNSTLTGAEALDASLLLPTDTVDAVETPPRVRSAPRC